MWTIIYKMSGHWAFYVQWFTRNRDYRLKKGGFEKTRFKVFGVRGGAPAGDLCNYSQYDFQTSGLYFWIV